ncbi:MAG: hypothetical protein SVS85_02030, partial [Candidatus Nanohaloarchaea archaeon]|nr:hypothetical protein [Candidatus Nanohaloarchaea archaeon]
MKQQVRAASIDQFREEEEEGKNARRRREVLAAIDSAETEWVSGRQMWKRCIELGYAHPPDDVYGSYQPRLNELVKAGLLEESGERMECPVTGNRVTHYR